MKAAPVNSHHDRAAHPAMLPVRAESFGNGGVALVVDIHHLDGQLAPARRPPFYPDSPASRLYCPWDCAVLQLIAMYRELEAQVTPLNAELDELKTRSAVREGELAACEKRVEDLKIRLERASERQVVKKGG